MEGSSNKPKRKNQEGNRVQYVRDALHTSTHSHTHTALHTPHHTQIRIHTALIHAHMHTALIQTAHAALI